MVDGEGDDVEGREQGDGDVPLRDGGCRRGGHLDGGGGMHLQPAALAAQLAGGGDLTAALHGRRIREKNLGVFFLSNCELNLRSELGNGGFAYIEGQRKDKTDLTGFGRACGRRGVG